MQLIIEVDKKYYEACKDAVEEPYPSQIEEVIANGTPYNPSGDCISRSVVKGMISDKSIPIKFEEEKRGNWQRSSGVLLSDIYKVIDNAPPAEPERPQGEWIDHMADKGYVECPFCHKKITGGDLNFCVKCGADMKGGTE